MNEPLMRFDRRQSPRIIVYPPLLAQISGTARPLVVVDVSIGGFRAEASEPVATDQIYACNVRTTAGKSIQVSAKAVYCQLRGDALRAFEVGFAFDQTDGPTAIVARALVEQVALALWFE